MSDISLPPEHCLAAARQRLWHETQLDKRLHARVQNRIVQRVDVLKVVDGLTLLVFAVDPHLILQEAVKANVLEAALPVHYAQISLPVGA